MYMHLYLGEKKISDFDIIPFLKFHYCLTVSLFSFFCLLSSQHQGCGGGVEQAGRVRGKDTQPAEEDPVRRHGQLPDQAGQ